MAYQLNPQQSQIARTGLQLTANDPQVVQRSLIEAMLVESGMRQIPGGDRDSTGVLQQRPSMGWGAFAPGLGGATTDMNDYLSRARRIVAQGFHGTAGQLAQSVQRSAFPGRYDEAKSRALAIINELHGAGGSLGGPTPLQSPAQAAFPQQSNNRMALLQNLVNQQNAYLTKTPYSGPSLAQTAMTTSLSAAHVGNQLDQHAQTLAAQGDTGGAGVVAMAKKFIGTPYVWGGSKPGGFDCSGLLQYVWGQHGVTIPRTTYDQFKAGQKVAPGQLQPGDAVFFSGSDAKNGLPGHVGMYIGNGKFIEAPHTGASVRVSNLNGYPGYVGARRY